jgi:ribosome-binding protein aMBF1 (putative translation factor)
MTTITKAEWDHKPTRAKKLAKVYKEAANPKKERSDTIKAIGKAIREKREAKKWTTYKLAEEAGIQRTYLINLENGKINPTVDTLEKIAIAMNCRLSIEFVRNKEKGEE